MKPEVKEKWVAALTSGEYAQEVGALRTPRGFCCLGVLCDVYTKDQDLDWRVGDDKEDPFSLLGADQTLPFEVMKWAGLDGKDPSVKANEEDEFAFRLTHLNDVRKLDFTQIAALIKEQL